MERRARLDGSPDEPGGKLCQMERLPWRRVPGLKVVKFDNYPGLRAKDFFRLIDCPILIVMYGKIPMETLLDLGKEYHNRFAALAPYRDAVWKVLVKGFFQNYIQSNATVLDLGAGWGEFTRNIQAGRRIAMDLNPDMPARVGPGVETILQDCSQTWQLPDNSVDVIFTSNFFEHLLTKDALRRTLIEGLRCLKPGGRLIALGPNIRALHGTYWDFWDHYLALSDRTMTEVLTLTGYAVERAVPRFLPYSMSLGMTPPVALVGLYLKLPFLWRFFGKQFLVVARKPVG